MNIEFFVNKEKQEVVIFNEKGKKKIREYQDNIKEILIAEDVVEGLESLHKILKINQSSLQGRIEATSNQIVEWQKKRKSNKCAFLLILIGFPILSCLSITSADYFLVGSTSVINSFFTTLNQAMFFGVAIDIIACLYGTVFSFSSNLTLKELKNKKEEFEKRLEEVNTRISLLQTMLNAAKNEIQRMIKQKERNNIQNMPNVVQEVPYREALEAKKAYLKQMYEENKLSEKEKHQKSLLVLSKKKKTE